ncbi:MAG TPA: extracellular solute-binding protein [Acholeplasmataceae bacterium]|nr:extracellular solute-binding protein [Acholeplasmataceae bacterium]
MKYRKMLILVLLASMFFGLVGCNGDDTIQLTVYSQLANYSGKMTGWFAQIMKEKFNVEMTIIPDTEGVYDTRMESGNLGDIVVWGGDGEQYLNAVKAGLLFDWEEDGLLDEFGPYIKENMALALEKNRNLSGGTVYGFGHNVAMSSEDHESFFYTWDIRWDLYDELGRPEINNLDDYYNLLVAMKEIEPVDDIGNPTYAVSLWPDWDGDMVMYVKAMATAYYGYDELGIGLYDPDTGNYYGALDENSPYLEMLAFFNKLYRANLLDPDSMSNTFDNMISKVKNGGTFFSIFNYAGSIAFNTPENIEQGKMMLPLTPQAARPIVYGMNVLGGNRIWSIGAKTQYPELCMEIINWLCTPEGRMISEYGPKGITWDYDEERNTHFTELGRTMRDNQDTTFPEETGFYGTFRDGAFQINNTTWSLDAINPDSNGERFHWDFWKSNQIDPRNDTEAKWREFTDSINPQDYMEKTNYRVSPGSSYSIGVRSSELKVKWEQVTETIKTLSWRAMYAKTAGEYNILVRQMRNNARDYGYDECLAWAQEQAQLRYSLEQAVKEN